jgi:hypothetical protein
VKDVALCAVIVGVSGFGCWAVQSWAFDASVETRMEPPPATNPGKPHLQEDALEELRMLTPPGEPAPLPPGVAPEELETRAA